MSTENNLLKDMKKVGIKVSSVWDLVNEPINYNAALLILIKYLESDERVRFKEGIARALGVKGFNDAVYPLIREYVKSDHDGYKWAIANTLSIIVPKEALDDLIEIMGDERHGRARQMIAETLGKIRDKKSVPVLIESLKDDEVAGHAVSALGMIGDEAAIEPIKPFLKSERRWVRKAAEVALRRIERKAQKAKAKL